MSAPTLADRVALAAKPSAALERCIDCIHAGRLPEALLHMQQAMSEPGCGPETWYWGGILCHQIRDYKGAANMLTSVLEAAPEMTPARYNRGVAFECLGLSEAAVADYRRAADEWGATSSAVPPLVNMGGSLYRLGKAAEGKAAHDRALAIDCTGDDEALTARSAVRLLRGDYGRGFAEYESRRALGQFKSANWEPGWGEDWQGQQTRSSVMLYHEQGAGDTIQMLRYAHAAAAMSGCPVTLCVQPELVALAKRLRDDGAVQAVVTREEVAQRSKPPRWHAPLMSMPYLAGRTERMIPPAPYLHSERRPQGVPFTVGLCWKGNPQHNNDRDRSVPTFDVLAPLFDVPGVRWVSLQQGAPFPKGQALNARDFAETADVVAGLDLVITIDSAVAHLAAALGVPTWVLVPTAPEWRWGTGETTPWYSTARLYRRRSSKEWGPMVERIAKDLARYV